MLSIINPHEPEEFFISKQNIITPNALRGLSVAYGDKCFFIQLPSGEKKYVKPYDLSGGLERNPSRDYLEKVLKVGKIYLTAVGEDYKLRLGISGKGGASTYESIVYWGTKVVICGSIIGTIGVAGEMANTTVDSAISTVVDSESAIEAVIEAARRAAQITTTVTITSSVLQIMKNIGQTIAAASMAAAGAPQNL